MYGAANSAQPQHLLRVYEMLGGITNSDCIDMIGVDP